MMNDPHTVKAFDTDLHDLARIVAIYNEAIPGRMATADTEPVAVSSRLSWFREHTPGRRPLWVVEREGVIVRPLDGFGAGSGGGSASPASWVPASRAAAIVACSSSALASAGASGW